jgi:hypothetical protein
MALVNKSCKRVLLLDKGNLVEDGPASSVLPKYLQTVNPLTSYQIHFEENPLAGKTGLSLQEIIINSGGVVRHGLPLRIDVALRTLWAQERLAFGIVLSSLDGTRLVSCDSDLPGKKISLDANHQYVVSITLLRLDLSPGSYLLDVTFRQDDTSLLDYRPACLRIEVLAPTDVPDALSLMAGGTRPAFNWTLNPL